MGIHKFYCRAYQFCFRCAAVFLPWRRPETYTDMLSLAQKMKEKYICKVLIVTDDILTSLGLHEGLLMAMDKIGIRYCIYDKTVANPTIQNIEEALMLYHKENCTGIIALGGGSPIDCAKGVAARAARPRKSISKMRGQLKILKKTPFLAAIPTTSGSGSEATLAAVVTDDTTHVKYAINDPALIPDCAVLDPALTVKLPPHITAATGMDALVHAVEAYIGKSNTTQTKKDAYTATQLIFENLYTAYSDGRNLTARKNMQTAAFLAGTAFTRAYVGNVHAIAHTLGGKYGTAHGLANAVIMPYVLDAYGSSIYRQLAELSAAAGIAGSFASEKEKAEAFITAVRLLNAKMGIPQKLIDLKHIDIPDFIRLALKEANPLYPVPKIFDKQDMEKIYLLILEENGGLKREGV